MGIGFCIIISVPFDYPTLIRRNIKMEGFTVTDRYLSQWFDGISVLRDWLLEVNSYNFT